jgi:hypothetical protein
METETAATVELSAEDKTDLLSAKTLLENPGYAARLTATLGGPLERGFALLPKGWPEKIEAATNKALEKGMDMALVTIKKERSATSSDMLHKVLAGVSGALGGSLGLATLAIELPVSTTIMLRSIADVARSEDADLNVPAEKLACLEVLGLGAPAKVTTLPNGPKVSEFSGKTKGPSSYWAYRDEIGSVAMETASLLSVRGLARTSAPAMLKFIATISSRFGVMVSQQVAAKAIPVIGAASGAVVNYLFIDHFQEMARGHFIVRRLEKKYGSETVRAQYMAQAIPA